MKHIFLTALSAFLCVTTFAADDWKTYFKNEQIEIHYRYSDCHDEANGIHQQKVFLKFVNLTNAKMEVSFSKELTYGYLTRTSTDINIYALQIKPNETKEGLCSDKDKALFIFSKHLNFLSSELKNFELKNISVKTIE